MSEFSSNAKKKTDYLSTLILSDFMLFCSFILSHPLYFAYFIFFSPYLFKILSFLSPLFATTSLLLLAIFTLTPTIVVHGSNFQLPKSKPSFLLSTYQTFVEPLQSEEVVKEDDFSCFQVLEAFKMAFESSDAKIQRDPIDVSGEMDPDVKIPVTEPAKDHPKLLPEAKQVKNLVAFFQEKEKLFGKKGEKEVKTMNTLTDKGEEQNDQELLKPVRGSKALEGEKGDEARSFITDDPRTGRLRSASSWGSENGDGKHKPNKLTTAEKNFSQPLESYREKVGTLGSMRREKEWRRTLACKLFEERNNAVEGGEGMDLLWETYETETAKKSSSSPSSHKTTHLRNGSKKVKSGIGNYSYNDHRSDYSGSVNVDEDYDEDDESEGSLCCLQAFKFSAGKMSLGMGRPGLVKISKALKGFGWLHHHVGGTASPRRPKKIKLPPLN